MPISHLPFLFLIEQPIITAYTCIHKPSHMLASPTLSHYGITHFPRVLVGLSVPFLEYCLAYSTHSRVNSSLPITLKQEEEEEREHFKRKAEMSF